MAEQTQNVKRLAEALNASFVPDPAKIEAIASALQGCLNDAAMQAEKRIEEKWGPRFDQIDTRLDRQDAAIKEIREHMDERLDRQDATLRMVWKQQGGNGSLPIDD